jgi:poly-beta-hydroxybutyrate-responsive repressor
MPHWRRIARFVQPCLLLLLQEGPAHGYSLTEGFQGLGFDEQPVDSSVVYRYLREMEEEGLVASEWDTEASAGPARRVYNITEEGNRALAWWVAGLRETDRVLHSFLSAYDRQVQEEG